MAITVPVMVKNLNTYKCKGYPMPIPDSIKEARRRIQDMIDHRYDGMCQKPEVLNDLQMIQVVYSGPLADPEALLAEIQAAALNTSVVAH